MGYRHIKHLESVEYNRKLFYLDRGAIDLPPITDLTSIAPGSEARSLSTGEKWILNTQYKWVWVGTGDCCCTGGNGSGGTNGSGSGDGDGDVPVPGEEPSIQGVTITPQNITVGLGAQIAFLAQIEGSSKLNQGITWSIKGQNSIDTKITSDGILKIAENEKNKNITVRATSQGDTKMFAQAVVTVDHEMEEPLKEMVTAVTIMPKEIEVIRGRSILFTTVVNGANLTNKDVVYSITGQTSGSTTIDSDGLLQISSDELSKLIVVKVVSAADPTISDVTTVRTVIESEASNPAVVTKVDVQPKTLRLAQGYSSRLAAEVIGELNPPIDVKWSVLGATDLNTRITEHGLLTIGENEKPGLITVIARSVYSPDQFDECDVQVLDASDPKVVEEMKTSTVTAVVVTPSSIDVPQNTQKIFSAVVIGNNDPSQVVTWKLTGQKVQTTYVTDQGVVVIGKGETAAVLTLEATSVQAPNVKGMAYIKVEEPVLADNGSIEEVPKAPLGARYVRQRLANGETAWVILPEEEDEGPVEPDPEIRDIDITPEATTVAPNSVITYTVKMETIGALSDEVTWSIKGNDSIKTHITPDGVLYIGDDETSKLITVRATSILDTTKYGRATVAVDKDAPLVTLVTGISLIPASAEIIRGRAMKFQTIVTGVNLTNTRVNFSLTGNNNLDTTIDQNGVLTVDKNESASVLIVTARSQADPSQSTTCVVAVIPEELATDVWEIQSIKILPEGTDVGAGYNTRLAAVISGVNNPPQDVEWSVSGGVDIETRITKDGVLYCGDEERAGRILYVTATAMYDPTKTATVRIRVLSADDPAVQETTITSVMVSPGMVESGKGYKVTFSATVLGRNNPSQAVSWAISGNYSSKTVINKLGVLTIGSDEEAKAITVRATSDADNTQFGTAYVTLTKAAASDPKTGIADVPEAPLNASYVRHRDASGKSIWKLHVDTGGGRGGYLGTFDSIRDLNSFVLPETAQDGDYAIVSTDANYGGYPTIYTVENGRMVHEATLGRPIYLGDKLDILYVLDNEVHSNTLRSIEELEDFDTNEKRWELHESEAAWKLVTELHSGFWNMIKHHPERFKAIVAMDRHTGETVMYLTCFTDEHEFIVPVYTENIHNPRPISNTLNWTNTVAKGNTFTAASATEFIQYVFDEENFNLSVLVQNQIPVDTEPGVSPWATVVGEYTLLKNGEVIGPLAGVTDPTGYIWTSNRENFMVGSAGDGTQMFVYNIDDDTAFVFDVPAGAKENYQMATDLNERYFMMFIDGTHAVWVDRKTQQVKQVVWRPTGYSGLSVPTALTRPSITIDGQYYLHTSTNSSTPAFTTFDFDTGDFVTESSITGTSSSAIGLSDGRRVATNTPEGVISIFNVGDDGSMTRIHYETPYAARYVVTPTGHGNQLLFVKVEAKANCPAWFVYDCDTYTVTSHSEFMDRYCEQTNPQGKGCSYIADSAGGPRYLLTFANIVDSGLIIEYDTTQSGVWYEYEIPFGGLGNDKHTYNQPLIMNDGRVIVTTDSSGNPRAYDMVDHSEIDMSDIPDGTSHDGSNNLVQIDDNHLAWCTGDGITVYRVEADGTRTRLIEIPQQQAIVLGFGQ